MPFSASDASRHTKRANTAKRRRQWAEVAESTRKKLIADGVDPKVADSRAIRAANSVLRGG